MVVISLNGSSPGEGFTEVANPTPDEASALAGVRKVFGNAQLYGND